MSAKKRHFVKASDSQMQKILKYGFISASEICILFGITKQTTFRAIQSGQLNAFMKGGVDRTGREFTAIRWYIVKDDKYKAFVEKHKKYNDEIE